MSTAQLLDSNAAVATLSAVERLKNGENVTQTVLFVDIGAVQTEGAFGNLRGTDQLRTSPSKISDTAMRWEVMWSTN
jgi:hypothetical protein